jgi:hypothetical protein
MRKIVAIVLVLFVFLTISAEQTENQLETVDFEYRPYKIKEFMLDSLALLGGVTVAAAISIPIGFSGDSLEGFVFTIVGAATISTPIMASAGIHLSDYLGHKGGGNYFAGVAGGYAMAAPFLLTAFLINNDLLLPSLVLATTLMTPGVMVGYAASRKTRLYSGGSLVMNLLGTVLGSVSGMLTHHATTELDIEDHSVVHAVPSIFLTVGGTFITFLISRYAIVDEPDNAGTWLGVMGGTFLGAMTGFGIGCIWKYSDTHRYDRGVTTALVIGGAILGELIGFASSHTTMPDRRTNPKEKKVSFSILPPMMIHERIPVVNKTIKRWMILNAGITF